MRERRPSPKLLGFLALCLALLPTLGCRRTYVASSCMEPLISMDTAVSFEPLEDRPLARGDIIAIDEVEDFDNIRIGRVIALPGDRVRIEAKRVFLNDRPLQEPYAVFRDPAVLQPEDPAPFAADRDFMPEITVGPTEIFVLCDNRDQAAEDSRFEGPFADGRIRGLIVRRR